jgi:hypothetical protein
MIAKLKLRKDSGSPSLDIDGYENFIKSELHEINARYKKRPLENQRPKKVII